VREKTHAQAVIASAFSDRAVGLDVIITTQRCRGLSGCGTSSDLDGVVQLVVKDTTMPGCGRYVESVSVGWQAMDDAIVIILHGPEQHAAASGIAFNHGVFENAPDQCARKCIDRFMRQDAIAIRDSQVFAVINGILQCAKPVDTVECNGRRIDY